MPRLSGQIAVITGANQGIGKGIARAFAAEGCRLAICARNVQKLETTAEELRAHGVEVLARPVDVSDEAAVDQLFDAVVQQFGRVDILVNNAGAFDGGRIDQLSLEAWERVVGTCLTGAFLCTRRAFAIMLQQGGGRILNIGSISAQRPRENNAPYAAAKFGVWGLTQATAIDGRPFGITAGCLHPGNVRIERRAESGKPMDAEPMMDIDTIAQAALAMVTVPPDVTFLEAIVLPREQAYLGRG
ncbi:MAG TPA: SDR family NAD(P)-dependent oxidoreductase [Planctomycetaceae bacterium]|nr:SDR family NAD(P)-dependent oxidoreductase [Planctomycetaceae bacterium]